MVEVEVMVSVGDSHLGRLDEVAAAAEAAGMTVRARQPALGVLTGSVAADKLDRLWSVPGVEHVEAQREVRVPPPDSPVQ